MSETMEGDGSGKAYGCFELREIPAKICATRAAFGCFQFREQEFLAFFLEVQNAPVQQTAMDGHITGASFCFWYPFIFGVRADKKTWDAINILNIFIPQVTDFSQPHATIGGDQCNASKGGL